MNQILQYAQNNFRQHAERHYGIMMTTLRLVLLTSLASAFGACSQIRSASPEPENLGAAKQAAPTQIAIQKMRFDALGDEFLSLSKIVEVKLLSNEQKTTYLRFLHACTSKQKQLEKEIASNNDGNYCQQKLFALELFFEAIKKTSLKVELLTVGKDESSYAFLAQPLDVRSYHNLVAAVHLGLYSWLESTWKNPAAVEPLTNTELTTMIYKALPGHIIQSSFPYFFTNEHRATLLSALSVDLYQDLPMILDEYLLSMEEYKKTAYVDDPKIQGLVAHRLDELIGSLHEKYDQEDSNNVKDVLNFFIEKLFCTKQALAFKQQLNDVNKLHPTLVSTFTKQYRLINSREFTTSYAAASPSSRQHLDRYILLVERFFSTQPFQSLLFVSDVEMMIAGFRNIKPTNPWTKDAFECMKDGLACAKELLARAQVTLGLKYATSDQPRIADNRLHIFDEMLEVLTSIHSHITKKPDAGSSWNDVFSYIRSGQWLTGGSIKNVIRSNDGNVSLEFANLGNQKFTDIRSAAFHALVCSSPFIFTKIVEYIKPQLDKKLGTQFDTLVSPKAGDAAHNHEKIIAFANSNPEILKQLNQHHPEILDLLADSLKELAQKHV